MSTCPECNGKCCRSEMGYRVIHMGAYEYQHSCDACNDGTVPKPDLRAAILAEWDRQPAHHREMCAHILLRSKKLTEEAIVEAGKQGWNATKSDLTGGVIALAIAMDLLAHKGER